MDVTRQTIESLLEQSWAVMISDPATAKQCAQKAIDLVGDRNELHCRAMCYVGLCEFYLGHFEEAIVVLSKALALAARYNQIDNSRRINNAMGMCYHSLGRYSAALDHYEFTVDIARLTGSPAKLVAPLINLACLLFDLDEIDASESIVNEVVGLDFTDVLKDNLVIVYLLQAQILIHNAKFEEADRVIRVAQELSSNLRFTIGIIRCQTLKGRIFRLTQCFDDAIQILQQAVQHKGIAGEGVDGLKAYFELHLALVQQHKYREGNSVLLEGMNLLKPPEGSPLRTKALEYLALGYEKQGDVKNELAVLKEIRSIEKETQGRSSQNLLNLNRVKRRHDQEHLKQQKVNNENFLLKESYERLSLLNDIAHEITVTLDFSELGRRLFPILKQHLDIHFISLMTHNTVQEKLYYQFIIDDGNQVPPAQFPDIPADGYSVAVMKSQQPVILNDVEVTQSNHEEISGRELPQSMLFIPLILNNEVLGVFSLQSPTPNRFGGYETKLILAICKFISIAVSNIISHEEVRQLNRNLYDEKRAIENAQERIAHMAYHDSLTSLPNRQALEELIDKRISIHQRPFHLVYIDLDGFKPVNDKYGHLIGDRVLIEISLRINDQLRQRDFASRVGGDEFVLIIDEFNCQEDLISFLNRMLRVIEEPILFEDREISVSASIGTAKYPDKGETLDSLMHNADSAMYTIKRQGKGGVLAS